MSIRECSECGKDTFKIEERDDCGPCVDNPWYDKTIKEYRLDGEPPDGVLRDGVEFDGECWRGSAWGSGCWIVRCVNCLTEGHLGLKED